MVLRSMLSYHPQNSDVENQKAEKLPNQIRAEKLRQLCRHGRIVRLLKWFSDIHGFLPTLFGHDAPERICFGFVNEGVMQQMLDPMSRQANFA